MVEEDITVKERTLKQMEDDRLGEEAARGYMIKNKLSGQTMSSAETVGVIKKFCFSHDTIGDYVTEDNFHVRCALIKEEGKQSPLPENGKGKDGKAMTCKLSTEAPIPSVPDVPQPPVGSSPKSSGTRRKSLGRNRLTKPKSILKELDLDADDKTFIKFVSDEDSTDEAPILWSALAGWEVISTPLGEINALYRSDQLTNNNPHFTTLREILHMVDRQDLLKLYGMVVKYYKNHLVAGAGLISWRLYTLSNVHVLETVSGEVLYMFADVSYPLSVKLMERMLKHKLEIDKDVVGNDMTTAEQLIRFIKNQIAAAQVSPV
ncbi:hypothetical protein Tco_1210903 [Tanacetum coccineum]